MDDELQKYNKIKLGCSYINKTVQLDEQLFLTGTYKEDV